MVGAPEYRPPRARANEPSKLLVRGPSLHHSNTPFPSIRADSQKLEHAFQFVVAEKGDFQSPLALGVAQMNFGPQALAQLVLQVGHVGITRHRRERSGP